MPVGMLLCEGVDGGLDARLLSAIASGVSGIRPAGSKYYLATSVSAYRDAKRQESGATRVVAAIRDCDFDIDRLEDDCPKTWAVSPNNQRIWIGWSWRRVEVENYLIDPTVVAKALQLSDDDAAFYQTALNQAATSLADYTAARYALSRSRQHGGPLENHWGDSAGLKDHVVPKLRDDEACREGITHCVARFDGNKTAAESVIARYEMARRDYAQDGARGQQPHIYYSGKDLLCALRPALAEKKWGEPGDFKKRVLLEIQRSQQTVWEWLAEWGELRRKLKDVTSNNGDDT